MNQEVAQEKIKINQKIEAAQERITELENDLREIDIELDGYFAERQKYVLISEINDRLDKLGKLGGSALFWGEDKAPDYHRQQYDRVNHLIINYDEKVNQLQGQREQIKEDIQSVIAQINILNEEIVILQERAEERKHEFIIEREMTVQPYRPIAMPWSVQGEDERRFRKAILLALFISIILGILIPMWHLPIPDREEVVEIPERLAKLIVEKEPPPPPPPPVEKKLEELKPEEEKRPRKEAPKPKTEVAKKARKKAENAGLLAFKDNFANLMDDDTEKKLGSQARIRSAGQKAAKATRSIVTAQAEGASGGINTAALSRNVGGGGSVEGVEFSRVESAIGSDFFGEERPLSEGPGPSRTDEEIQIVFDRYKAALYRIYNRQLRTNPTLQGKLVLKLTIEPDGTVSKCELESSDMNAPALESKIVDRVKRFNFGPKEGVPAITIRYPIDFLPAT